MSLNKICMTQKPTFTHSIKSSEKKHHLHCAHMCKNIYYKKADVLLNKHKNTLYIAIEGTDTVINWIDNISVAFKTNDIHRGFLRYANHCMHKYDPLKDINDVDRVTICGHSLGSASATLLAYHMCKESEINNVKIPSNIELVLFGCPKIGGETFKNELNRLVKKSGLKITNYQNDGDLVCSIPFGFLGYHTTFQNSDTILMQTSNKPVWDISDHYMSEYINNVENLEEYHDNDDQ